MSAGDILAPVDIKDPHPNVPIFLAHQCYMCFALGTQLYLFVAFSFHLSTALHVFTKMLKHVLTLLCSYSIPIVGYLDNFLLR